MAHVLDGSEVEGLVREPPVRREGFVEAGVRPLERPHARRSAARSRMGPSAPRHTSRAQQQHREAPRASAARRRGRARAAATAREPARHAAVSDGPIGVWSRRSANASASNRSLATPSASEWCTFVTYATCPSASPSTNHTCHSGRSRSSPTLAIREMTSANSRRPAGRRHRDPLHVVVEIEVGCVDPVRMAEIERHPHEPPPERLEQRERFADLVAQRVVVDRHVGAGRVDDRDLQRVLMARRVSLKMNRLSAPASRCTAACSAPRARARVHGPTGSRPCRSRRARPARRRTARAAACSRRATAGSARGARRASASCPDGARRRRRPARPTVRAARPPRWRRTRSGGPSRPPRPLRGRPSRRRC